MQKPFLHLAAVLALSLVYLGADLPNAECLNSANAADINASMTAIGLQDDDEFLMESETSRRILAAGKTISRATLKKDISACQGDVYGSCSGMPGKIVTDRKCDYQNLCGHRGS